MDRDAIRAWKRGHELAEAKNIEAARAMPVRERAAQTWLMARSARELGWSTTDPEEVARVRARFALLHARAGIVR